MIVPNTPFVGAVPVVKVNALPSGSVPDKVIVTAVSSLVVTDCAVAVGGSLAAVMEILTVAAALLTVPSWTVNVKLSDPV